MQRHYKQKRNDAVIVNFNSFGGFRINIVALTHTVNK